MAIEIPHCSVPIKKHDRPSTIESELDDRTPSFVLGKNHKSYKHQFANLYFARLTLLKSIVEAKAKKRWRSTNGSPPLVPRVLDVTKDKICYIVGTVFWDMPQKPNVLEDVAQDKPLPAIAEREKYHSTEDALTLEDESGRIQLVGSVLRRIIDKSLGDGNIDGDRLPWADMLVTGIIMAALGYETPSGEFEVKDVCFAGMAPMMYAQVKNESESMDVDEDNTGDEWIAFISGLQSGETADIRIQMLLEYLAGETGEQREQNASSQISRLFIVGNSLAPVAMNIEKQRSIIEAGPKSRRFGQDTNTFSTAPTESLGDFLLEIANVMPVHLLAGATDPSGTLLPQQPLPRAMFGSVKEKDSFKSETNPLWMSIESPSRSMESKRLLLIHSGQSLEDMYKYVPSPPTTRLDLACATLHWRHAVPTAPDTVWCYPYLTDDPFVLRHTPDLYVLGCQPEFATRFVRSGDYVDAEDEEEKRCRVVLVPEFKDSGLLVMVNMRNLDVKAIKFDSGMGGCDTIVMDDSIEGRAGSTDRVR